MAGLTLEAPDRVWLLLLPTLLGALYLLGHARRIKYVTRFTNIELVDSVLPHNPGWRRHIPAIAILAALALMALGLAHPSRLHQIARRQGLVVLDVDVSPSMMATDVTPSREVAAKRAITAALATIPPTMQVALVSFAGTAVVDVPPTLERHTVRQAINHLEFRSFTSYTAAITTSLAVIGSVGRVPAGVVMVSDGCPCIDPGPVRQQAINQARKDHVPISVVIVGTPSGVVHLTEGRTPVPVDRPTLDQIASGTGGKSFSGTATSTLSAVFHSIGAQVEVDWRLQDLSGWFFAAAFVLVLAGAALSLAWFARMP
ncbi:MAG: VWA domain-containing protein [Acidimicrobiales bacterium]